MHTELLYHAFKHILPATFALLPGRMESDEAKAMLLAIALQESRFKARVQLPNGPAHGFWQFEKSGGVRAVLGHPVTAPLILPVLQTLNYQANEMVCYQAITHNDTLACAFARLLLWSVPGALPRPNESAKGWAQYISAWRPGKPYRETWDRCFNEAWRTVSEE